MNRVLVTGSSGFIGSHLANYLAQAQYEVHGLDLLPPATQNSNMRFYEVDLTNEEKIVSIIASTAPDCIIHLAARTDLEEEKNIAGYSPNIQGVANLIQGIRSCPSVRRVIFTSSQLVCRVGYVPEHEEDYAPTTLYGESKVLTEKIVRSEKGGGREWCITRPTSVWGPGMSPHYQRLLSMIKRGTYFHIGTRPLYKSYSYIGNIVYQYTKLLEAPSAQIQGRTFYLADYQPMSIREWTDALQKEFGARRIKTYPELLARLAARIGDALNRGGLKQFPFNSFRLNNILTEYQFDLSNTRDVCGPLPYSMDDGVKATVAWMNQKTGIEPEQG